MAQSVQGKHSKSLLADLLKRGTSIKLRGLADGTVGVSLGSGAAASGARGKTVRKQKAGRRRNQNPRQSAAEKGRRSRNYAERSRRQRFRRETEVEAPGRNDRRDPIYQLTRLGFLEVPKFCPGCAGLLKRQSCHERAATLYRCSNQHCRKRLGICQLSPILARLGVKQIHVPASVILTVVQLHWSGQTLPPKLADVASRLAVCGTAWGSTSGRRNMLGGFPGGGVAEGHFA